MAMLAADALAWTGNGQVLRLSSSSSKAPTRQRRCSILQLSPEILMHCFSFLTAEPHDLVAVSQVCSSFYNVLQVELLWKETLRQYLEDRTAKREELRPPFLFTSLDLNSRLKNEKECCTDAVGQQQACGIVRAGQGRVSRNYQHVFQKVVRHKKNNVGSVSLKIVMMGNSAVGKTSLLSRWHRNEFSKTNVPRAFGNCSSKVFYGDREIEVLLYDTHTCDTTYNFKEFREHRIHAASGGEDHKRFRIALYPNTDVFLFCFDTTDKSSLDSIENHWVPEVKKFMTITPHLYVLCGTKLDCVRAVATRDGMACAKRIGACAYIECSSSTGEGIAEVILACADSAFKHLQLCEDPALLNRFSEETYGYFPFYAVDNMFDAMGRFRAGFSLIEKYHWPDVGKKDALTKANEHDVHSAVQQAHIKPLEEPTLY